MPLRSRLAWIVGPLAYLILEAVAAAAFPQYSYAHNFISELGVPSASPQAFLMNIAFCLQGTLFLVGAIFLGGSRLFLSLVAANAVGNVLVAIFHSGVPIHAVGAVLAIVGGNAAVLTGPRFHRGVSTALGVFGLVSFVIFVLEMRTPTVGVWERCSVYSILVWQMFTATGTLWTRLDR